MYHTILGRAAAALVLAVALLPPLGGSPGVAHADTGFIDITGSPVAVDIRYPEKDTGSMTEVPIPNDRLSQEAQQFVATPLNQFFDQYWSGTQDKGGQTMRDHSCDEARSAVASQVKTATGQTAYNITCNFAATGALGARQLANFDQLSYVAPQQHDRIQSHHAGRLRLRRLCW